MGGERAGDSTSNAITVLSLFSLGVLIGCVVGKQSSDYQQRHHHNNRKSRRRSLVNDEEEEERRREKETIEKAIEKGDENKTTFAAKINRISSKELYETDEIVREHFTRNVQFFSEGGQLAVADSFCVVVGLGGVGSHCAAMLVRSGVRRIRVVDFDQVSLSSLNRHALATREDVGKPKADVLRAHFQKIFPECDVEVCNVMCEKKTEEIVLGNWLMKNSSNGSSSSNSSSSSSSSSSTFSSTFDLKPSYVIDCIDNCDTKVDLLEACARREIPIISSGGAGSKCDPTRLKICDISNANFDPLMRAIKYNLRKKYGISRGVDCLVSVEKQVRSLVTEVELKEGETLRDYQVVPNFRVRTIPVLGTVPAMFGCALASFVLCKLSGTVQLDPDEGNDVDTKINSYQVQLDRLKDREENRGSKSCALDVDINDIAYLLKDIWQRRDARALASAGDDLSKTPWKALNNLEFCRWDVTKPASIDNLVLLERSECSEWEDGGEHAIQRAFLKEPEFVQVVTTRLRRIKLEHNLVTVK